MSSILNPLGDRIVAIQESVEPKTPSGIFLPDDTQEKPNVAKIVAVGPKSSLSINERVLYKEHAETEIMISGTAYLIIDEEDVLATIN